MAQFPLYSTLMLNIKDRDLNVTQKLDLIKKISSLDTDAHELIYALIKCFYMEHSNGELLSIPYNGQINKDKIEFNLLKMPPKLRQLLYKFLFIHKKKIEEDDALRQ